MSWKVSSVAATGVVSTGPATTLSTTAAETAASASMAPADARNLGVGQLVKEMLGVEGGSATGARGGDGLAVVAVDEVATREHAAHVGGGGAALHEHVARRIGVDHAANQLVAGIVTNRYK